MKSIQQLIHIFKEKKYILTLLLILPSILFLHYHNSLSFAFTDAYNSYARAYFMLQGRTLYAEIFSHHNFLMVYLSYIIQYLARPDSLLQMVVYHRLFMGVASSIFAAFLIWRFRWTGVVFVAAYETSKYYLFGDLFLAEGLVAYLLIIMLGITWEKWTKKKISKFDILLSIVCAWAIALLREPLIPPAFVLFLYILWDKRYLRLKAITVTLLIGTYFMIVLTTLDLYEYYYHMIPLNFGGYIQAELAKNSGSIPALLASFLYPILILTSGVTTEFRLIFIIIDLLFLLGIIHLLRQKKYKEVIALLLILGLSNIRIRTPGEVFYAALHMLPYYAVFLYTAIHLTFGTSGKWLKKVSSLGILVVIVVSILPPFSPIGQRLPREEQFTVKYSRFVQNGEVIKMLSEPSDTLFVDGWDTLVYPVSGLNSSYRYAMYFPIMDNIDKFRAERMEMFVNQPPDFFYTDCGENDDGLGLTPQQREMYARLSRDGHNTCILIHSQKVNVLSQEKLKEVEKMGYSLPQ